ncbi:MAG TPA: Amuc_1100 family pilus-like protein [Verrucomicrobiae bacterium]|jgi:hypothetical protein
MLWLKRNLFLTLGGLVAVVLLAVGSVYLFGSFSKNSAVDEAIKQAKNDLKPYYQPSVVFPSQTNITLAKQQKIALSQYSVKAAGFFTPVPFDKKVKGQEFKQLLDNTLYDLRRQAEQAGVGLPVREYAFSFTAQKSKLSFSADTFPAVVEQLAEVQTLAGILIQSKVNRLEGIKRARVCSDDSQSPTEYHQLRVVTNPATGAISSPYEIAFQCFSAELAAVMESLMKSPQGFLIKTLMVETNAAAPVTIPAPPVQPKPQPGVKLPVVTGQLAPQTGLVTVLNERPFRVTMLIDVVNAGK